MLERDKLAPKRFEYLSEEDSELYDRVKDSENQQDIEIRLLLEDKAESSRFSHLNSMH